MRTLSILLLALLLVGWNMVCKSVNELAKRRSLEAFAGAKLPDNAKLFYQQDYWRGFPSYGRSARGYMIDKDAEWINEKRCDRNGFSKGKASNMTVRLSAPSESLADVAGNVKNPGWNMSIPVPKRYLNIDDGLPVCYKHRAGHNERSFIFVQGKQVVYYWEVD